MKYFKEYSNEYPHVFIHKISSNNTWYVWSNREDRKSWEKQSSRWNLNLERGSHIWKVKRISEQEAFIEIL